MDLGLIRRRHKWLTLIILFFIGGVFIFGMGSFVTDFGFYSTAPKGTAAEVNGEEISMREYLLERDNMRRQFAQSGQELPQAVIDMINMRALNQLIDFKLMAQKAKDLGFVITDEEFNNAIHSDPAFQIDGKFVGAERYRNFIEQVLNQNVPDFENLYKERMLAQKLGLFIGETVTVTDAKLLRQYNLQNEQANLYYIEFSSADFQGADDPAEEEINSYYEKNKANFKTEELRTLRYIVLEPETFENNIQISDEELNAYYNAYPEEFQSEDGGTLSYEDAKGDVEASLKSLRAETNRKEFVDNFAISQSAQNTIDQIAKDYGVESVNKTAPFSRSQSSDSIPPLVLRKTYSMTEGGLAVVPVATSVWVIELSDISEPKEKTIEESKPDIVAALKEQQAIDQASRKANQTLVKLKSAKKEEITDKAKEMGVELKETGGFTRMDTVPEINIEAVKSEVFEIDENEPTLTRVYNDQGKFYVFILKEKISADPDDFDLQKEELREQELQTQRNEVLMKWIQNLRREADIVPNDSLFPTQG